MTKKEAIKILQDIIEHYDRMSADYIILKAISGKDFGISEKEFDRRRSGLKAAIEFLQEPERRHGRWIYDVPLQEGEERGDFDLTCSVCGNFIQCCYTKDEADEFKKYNRFCSNCGAEMDGGTENV